jgi:isopentenyldiphosphate isomerase
MAQASKPFVELDNRKMNGELLDILNPDGSLSGCSALRSTVHREGLWHRSVYLWLFDGGESVLLQRRSMNKDSHPGLWDLSVSGHLMSGENTRAAVVREIGEELGLVVASYRVIYQFTGCETHHLPGGTDREFYDLYTAILSGKEIAAIVPDSRELIDIRWCTIDELTEDLRALPDLFVPHDDMYRWLFTVHNVL